MIARRTKAGDCNVVFSQQSNQSEPKMEQFFCFKKSYGIFKLWGKMKVKILTQNQECCGQKYVRIKVIFTTGEMKVQLVNVR